MCVCVCVYIYKRRKILHSIFDSLSWMHGTVFFCIVNYMFIYFTQNVKSGLAFWKPGVLPPALIAFDGHVHPVDSSWLVTGLGYRHQSEQISRERLEAAAVVHFNGPAKPWLEIGSPEVRSLWNTYVNFSDKFIRSCRITA